MGFFNKANNDWIWLVIVVAVVLIAYNSTCNRGPKC